jgi:hypothetical protein
LDKIKIAISILILFNYGCIATIKTIDFSSSSTVPNAVVKGLGKADPTCKDPPCGGISFKIVGVNGRPVNYGLTGDYINSIVKLDEGNNKTVIEAERYGGFFKGLYYGRGEINVFLSGGGKYQVNGTYDGLIHMWVEDMETKEKVSNVVDLYLVPKPTDTYIPIPIFIPHK